MCESARVCPRRSLCQLSITVALYSEPRWTLWNCVNETLGFLPNVSTVLSQPPSLRLSTVSSHHLWPARPGRHVLCRLLESVRLLKASCLEQVLHAQRRRDSDLLKDACSSVVLRAYVYMCSWTLEGSTNPVTWISELRLISILQQVPKNWLYKYWIWHFCFINYLNSSIIKAVVYHFCPSMNGCVSISKYYQSFKIVYGVSTFGHCNFLKYLSS